MYLGASYPLDLVKEFAVGAELKRKVCTSVKPPLKRA
jgi:hypothetical protein